MDIKPDNIASLQLCAADFHHIPGVSSKVHLVETMSRAYVWPTGNGVAVFRSEYIDSTWWMVRSNWFLSEPSYQGIFVSKKATIHAERSKIWHLRADQKFVLLYQQISAIFYQFQFEYERNCMAIIIIDKNGHLLFSNIKI